MSDYFPPFIERLKHMSWVPTTSLCIVLLNVLQLLDILVSPLCRTSFMFKLEANIELYYTNSIMCLIGQYLQIEPVASNLAYKSL
jgi:hypothetical protein